MVIGLITRHYKIYKGINYIPIGDCLENNLAIYVGNNGVGKSSILEALNTFFNSGYWNRHKEGKQDETFICPVFLIPKADLDAYPDVTDADRLAFKTLSDHFWSVSPSSSDLGEFVNTRSSLSNIYNSEEYYLMVVGCTFKERNKIYFGSGLQTSTIQVCEEALAGYSLDRVLTHFRRFYSFVYIPVESKVADTLKLETFEMQQLMNKNILEEIDNVLKNRVFNKPGGSSMISSVDYLNIALNGFMEDINTQVKDIDTNYSFKVDSGYKRNLTAYDLREKILEAYFSIRTLKKESKEIHELSSGEQRIALIDIATAFLNNSGDKDGFLILAIDEPEASMHVSKCFGQFKRLEKITQQDDFQVMLTTHWYGSLPTIQKGNLHHIDSGEKPTISTFDFLNYQEERRNFPDDIEMKSFFELVSTIISSIKNEKINWLICEGSDDKMYLNHYLGNDIENFHIMPVGGCGNVIKLYEYLYAPFSEKKEKALLTEGKVLCLIDSDIEQKTSKMPSHVDRQLKISRLQLNSDNSFELKTLENVGRYEMTAMEDCLNPEILYNSLTQSMAKESSSELIDLFNQFEYNSSTLNSRIIGESGMLKPKEVEALSRKNELYTEFKRNSFKYSLSAEYVELAKTTEHDEPEVFGAIRSFFNSVS